MLYFIRIEGVLIKCMVYIVTPLQNNYNINLPSKRNQTALGSNIYIKFDW